MFEEGREVLEPKQKHGGAFNGLPSSCDQLFVSPNTVNHLVEQKTKK